MKRIALATTLLGGWGGIAGALYLYQYSGKAALVTVGISIVLSFAGHLVYARNDDGMRAEKLESAYSESENRLKADPVYAKLIEELERQREGG